MMVVFHDDLPVCPESIGETSPEIITGFSNLSQ